MEQGAVAEGSLHQFYLAVLRLTSLQNVAMGDAHARNENPPSYVIKLKMI
jgi:hypothetical protein